jgi:Protein of unknown function (DUF3455)
VKYRSTMMMMPLVLMMPLALMALLAGCAAASPETRAEVPESLRIAADPSPALRTHGVGVQIYRCLADKENAARFEWQLLAPEADLFDHAGKKLGRHYAGPTWEALDGSVVTGEVAARADSPDPGSIAWLLLRAKTTSGRGIFGDVRFIQRLRTVGGSAPAGGCSPGTAGSEVRVRYSADYWFY